MTGAEVANNIAEIRLSETGVHISLEIFAEDMPVFEALFPDDWLPQPSPDRPPLSDRLADFSRTGLSIATGTGNPLQATLGLIEPRERVTRASPLAGQVDPVTGRRYPEPPADRRVIYAELFYPFEGQRPKQLTVAPPSDHDGNPTAQIGMIVFDRDVAVTDFRYLARPSGLGVDWSDPWYTAFDDPKLMRHHRYPMMAFLYAEPYEIRYEALMRVRDAARLAGVTLSGTTLTDAERAQLESQLPQALGALSPMTLDGKPARPDFERLSFLRLDPTGLAFAQPGEKISTVGGIVGLIYSAPTSGLPKRASVKWQAFTPAIQKVPGNAIDAVGPFFKELTPDDPVLEWENYFKVSPYPKVGAVVFDGDGDTGLLVHVLGAAVLICCGAVAVSTLRPTVLDRRWAAAGSVGAVILGLAIHQLQLRQQAARIDLPESELVALTQDLLANVYRAFDFKTENQVYDRLKLTLEGNVLEQVYLDQRRALRVERAGGAQARVDRINVTRVEKPQHQIRGELRFLADWQISGQVGHWGHSHRRTNAYRAELRVVPNGGVWKITGFDILSQERQL